MQATEQVREQLKQLMAQCALCRENVLDNAPLITDDNARLSDEQVYQVVRMVRGLHQSH